MEFRRVLFRSRCLCRGYLEPRDPPWPVCSLAPLRPLGQPTHPLLADKRERLRDRDKHHPAPRHFVEPHDKCCVSFGRLFRPNQQSEHSRCLLSIAQMIALPGGHPLLETALIQPLRLLEPLSIGDLRLANRVFMAPLTRCRASAGRVPNALMRDYYRSEERRVGKECR